VECCPELCPRLMNGQRHRARRSQRAQPRDQLECGARVEARGGLVKQKERRRVPMSKRADQLAPLRYLRVFSANPQPLPPFSLPPRHHRPPPRWLKQRPWPRPSIQSHMISVATETRLRSPPLIPRPLSAPTPPTVEFAMPVSPSV